MFCCVLLIVQRIFVGRKDKNSFEEQKMGCGSSSEAQTPPVVADPAKKVRNQFSWQGIVSIIHRVLYIFLVSNWHVDSKFKMKCIRIMNF